MFKVSHYKIVDFKRYAEQRYMTFVYKHTETIEYVKK